MSRSQNLLLQTRKWIAEARKKWASNELEIDADATVAIGDDGVWIQAWVFVEKDEPDDEPGGYRVGG
jgi:hypothetical protein